MPAFKDTNGREWLVKIDAPKIKDVRKELQFDLMADTAGQKLYEDNILLVDVLWVLCRTQANDLQLTDVQFGESLVGDPIDHATAAMLEALADFFPSRKRSLLRDLNSRQAAIMEKGTALARTRINNPELETTLLANLEKTMDESLAKVLTGLSGATNSQA